MNRTKRKFKILCIDGGGIKGLFSATILSKFEEVFNTKIHEQFDLICGTSTGGIIALGASAGKDMSDIVSFYEEDGQKIFAEPWKKKFGIFYKLYLNIRRTLWGTMYSGKPLEHALTRVFQDRTLGSSKTLLCIPAFNITNGKPRVFKKDYGKYTEDSKLKYVDVAMATSAAPTYLPIRKIGNSQYVDGGLWANNPVLVGLSEFVSNFEDDNRFDGVQILSISSYENSTGETVKKTKRSFWGWKDTLFDDYSVGQSCCSLFYIEQLKKRMPIELIRITNRAPSKQQSNIITMDNASKKALFTLKSEGEGVAMNMKMKKEIENIFKSGKTIKNGK
jgi:patatin-like phospholipase/acyl hydrolase